MRVWRPEQIHANSDQFLEQLSQVLEPKQQGQGHHVVAEPPGCARPGLRPRRQADRLAAAGQEVGVIHPEGCQRA